MVSAANPTLKTTASSAITLGTTAPTLSESALLANGYYETGSVVFTLSLGSTQVYSTSDTVTGTGNGTYSASYTLPTTGTVDATYTWSVSYAGDTNNNAASIVAGSTTQTVVSKANPTLLTTASPAITLGTTAPMLSDSAVLAGGYYETGSLVFAGGPAGFRIPLHSDTLSGNGTYTAGDVLPTTGRWPGTYTWTVGYAGDANNNGASSWAARRRELMISARPAPRSWRQRVRRP